MYALRKIYKHGSSLLVGVPREFSPPKRPIVYLGRNYVAYSEVYPLEDVLRGARMIGRVRLREHRGKLAYTVPEEAVQALRLAPGDPVLVLRYEVGREPLIAAVPRPSLAEVFRPVVFRS